MRRGVLFLLATMLVARESQAQEVHELKKELAVDIPFTVTALTLVVGLELAKADLAPKKARWYDANPTDEAARDLMRWKDPKTAATVSDGVLIFFAPATAFGTLAAAASHDDALVKTPTDGLIVLEASAANLLLNQAVKYTVARERPYGRFPTPLETAPNADGRLSFYSGHTSTTFCLAAASGTVAYMRGYEIAPVAWIPGAVLAAFTGYLRVAADKHYFTDVLTGAVVGTAVGILFPLLLHPRVDDAPPPSPTLGTTTATQAFSLGSSF